jgi:hypothetical protein
MRGKQTLFSFCLLPERKARDKVVANMPYSSKNGFLANPSLPLFLPTSSVGSIVDARVATMQKLNIMVSLQGELDDIAWWSSLTQ